MYNPESAGEGSVSRVSSAKVSQRDPREGDCPESCSLGLGPFGCDFPMGLRFVGKDSPCTYLSAREGDGHEENGCLRCRLRVSVEMEGEMVTPAHLEELLQRRDPNVSREVLESAVRKAVLLSDGTCRARDPLHGMR